MADEKVETPKIAPAPVTAPAGTATVATTTREVIGTPTNTPPASPPPADFMQTMMYTLVPMFVLFYFLLIRPENKRRKEQQSLLSAVKKGDKVVLTIGVYGNVAEIDGDDVTLIIDPKKDVRIKVRKEAIGSIVDAKKE